MGGKGYQQLDDGVFLIAGGNVDIGELCGTNCFAVGRGKERWLIDACKNHHQIFLDNIKNFLSDQNCNFEAIFITHAHYDHMDGIQQLVEFLE